MTMSTHDLHLYHAQTLADATGEAVKVVALSDRLRKATGAAVAFTRRGWPLEGRVIATVTPTVAAVEAPAEAAPASLAEVA